MRIMPAVAVSMVITITTEYPCLNTKYLSGVSPRGDYNSLNNEDGCS